MVSMRDTLTHLAAGAPGMGAATGPVTLDVEVVADARVISPVQDGDWLPLIIDVGIALCLISGGANRHVIIRAAQQLALILESDLQRGYHPGILLLVIIMLQSHLSGGMSKTDLQLSISQYSQM